jgi:hypothetical protein
VIQRARTARLRERISKKSASWSEVREPEKGHSGRRQGKKFVSHSPSPAIKSPSLWERMHLVGLLFSEQVRDRSRHTPKRAFRASEKSEEKSFTILGNSFATSGCQHEIASAAYDLSGEQSSRKQLP